MASASPYTDSRIVAGRAVRPGRATGGVCPGGAPRVDGGGASRGTDGNQRVVAKSPQTAREN